MAQLWGGRFTKQTDKLAYAFNASISFDQRLLPQDIAGSSAHVKMLAKQGILTSDERDAILRGLKSILEDTESGKLEITGQYEDVHSFVEANLIERVGDAGKKLHTGRSRNDQVALDMKLYVRDEIGAIDEELKELLQVLLKQMEINIDTFMPGFTHLQKAQPTTLAHHLGAYFEMFRRDRSRLSDIRRRLNLCPLGSGALAGTTYPLDRTYTAELLGFDGPTRNSMDSVSDRDYVIELLSALSVIMMHLSRFAEEVILWNSNEYRFVEIDDGYSTGSSIMPQKKNPLSAEHIKSRTAHLSSAYMDIVMCLKGTVYSHSRDLFECMPPFWNCMEQMTSILELTLDMLHGIVFNYDRMERLADTNNSVLTDVSDFLERRGGFPFRSAHNIVALAISESAAKQRAGIALSDLNYISQKVYGHDTSITEEEWAALMSAHNSVSNKASEGSPSPGSCRKMFLSLRATVNRDGECLDQLLNSLQLSEQFRLEQINALMNSTAN